MPQFSLIGDIEFTSRVGGSITTDGAESSMDVTAWMSTIDADEVSNLAHFGSNPVVSFRSENGFGICCTQQDHPTCAARPAQYREYPNVMLSLSFSHVVSLTQAIVYASQPGPVWTLWKVDADTLNITKLGNLGAQNTVPGTTFTPMSGNRYKFDLTGIPESSRYILTLPGSAPGQLLNSISADIIGPLPEPPPEDIPEE